MFKPLFFKHVRIRAYNPSSWLSIFAGHCSVCSFALKLTHFAHAVIKDSKIAQKDYKAAELDTITIYAQN